MDRVVISGYGLKAPGALDKQSFKRVLEEGLCTHESLSGKGPNETNVIAGIIRDDFLLLREKNYKRYSRSTRLAMAATDDACEMARLHEIEPTKVGIILGTSGGSYTEVEQYAPIGYDLKKYPLHGISLGDTHTLSKAVASFIGVSGPAMTISTGCTSSIDAMLMAKLMLESGLVNACIVGGTDSTLGQWSFNGFFKLKTIISNTEVSETGVPFSMEHKGFVLSEGAGVLILERESDAKKRGATIYGVIDSIVSRNESKPLLQSDLTGTHMLSVLKEAVGEEAPCYMNSQALGIQENDQIEATVHRTLFGNTVPITSIKGMIGHTFGAVGALQVISALISMEYSFIPPTIKTRGYGYEDLPIVFQTQYKPVHRVGISTHGNSGNNACLFVSKSNM
jgi:3-oxoacyl-(acyl-carrier-protein) synthase